MPFYNPDLKAFLKAFSSRFQNSTFDWDFNQQDLIACFQGWKESTRTSPSGIHLGHYKTVYMEDGIKYPPDLGDPKHTLLKIHTQLIWLCIKMGWVLTDGPDISPVTLRKIEEASN